MEELRSRFRRLESRATGRIVRLQIRRMMRKSAWAKYRRVHGWAEKDLVPWYALPGFMLMGVAYALILAGWRSPFLLGLGVVCGVFSLMLFLLDRDAPRQTVKTH